MCSLDLKKRHVGDEKKMLLKKRISCKTELQGPTSSPTISLKLRRGEDVVNLVLHTSEHNGARVLRSNEMNEFLAASQINLKIPEG